MLELLLTLISGVAWSIVYLSIIRIGFKEKTYGMPLVALGLNLAWELLYAYSDIVLRVHGEIGVQGVVNGIWAFLDCIILFTFFKYGLKDSYVPHRKKIFILGSIFILVACFAVQIAFITEFGWVSADGVPEAARYSAFLQNFAMSLLFINFYFMRKGNRGQSVTIAFAKWVGTLAPTILMGIVQSFNPFIIICGLFCSIFDIFYIYLLSSKRKLFL